MMYYKLMDYIRQYKSKVEDSYKAVLLNHRSIEEAKEEGKHIKYYLDPQFALTKDEKFAIRDKYGKVVKSLGRGYDFFQAMKCLDKFNSDYLPSSYYYPCIIYKLNDPDFKKYICNKSLLKIIYQSDAISHPFTPVRTLAGVYLDDNNKQISARQAAKILSTIEGPLLFKPSTDSSCGAGIKVIDEAERDEFINAIVNNYFSPAIKTDFVVQSFISQSPDTAIFNSTSLNCLRITTLNLNGKVSSHSVALKCGATDAVVDNLGNGKRGVMVAVRKNGELASHGFYGNGEQCQEHNGIPFAGHRIAAADKAVSAALSLHKSISSCHVIGWDIALDENNNPVLIEGNTLYPGISIEQMCTGPIFGDRMDEVIHYLSDYMHINK